MATSLDNDLFALGEIGPLDRDIPGLDVRFEPGEPPWTIRRDWERDCVDQWARNEDLLDDGEPFQVRPSTGGWIVRSRSATLVEWYASYREADLRRVHLRDTCVSSSSS